MDKKTFVVSAVLLVFCLIFSTGLVVQGAVVDLEGRTIVLDLDEPAEDSAMARRIAETADRYNVQFEYNPQIGWQADDAIMSSIIEGEPICDIFVVRSNFLYVLDYRQLLYPLDDFLESDYFDNLPSHQRVLKDFLEVDGQIKALPEELPFMSSLVVYYDKDIIQERGAPDPWELYQEGNWTLDIMVDIVSQVHDPENDIFGIDELSMFYELIHPLFDVELFETMEDGTVIPDFTQENHLQALEYLGELYKYSQFDFERQGITFFVDSLQYLQQVEDRNLGIVPFPATYLGGENNIYLDQCQLVVIPITEENPEVLSSIARDIFRPEEDYERDLRQIENLIADEEVYSEIEALLNDMEVVSQSNRLLDVTFYQEDNELANEIFNELYLRKAIDTQIVEQGVDPEQAMRELQYEVEQRLLD